jgi:hypothetical protein
VPGDHTTIYGTGFRIPKRGYAGGVTQVGRLSVILLPWQKALFAFKRAQRHDVRGIGVFDLQRLGLVNDSALWIIRVLSSGQSREIMVLKSSRMVK